jgi:hypothetical protein
MNTLLTRAEAADIERHRRKMTKCGSNRKTVPLFENCVTAHKAGDVDLSEGI